MTKIKRTNNDLQNFAYKTKDRVMRTPPKNRGCAQVLWKGQQFLLHQWHPSCYSSYKPGDKSLMRKGLGNLYVRLIIDACWNLATYKWKVHYGKIEIISFVVKCRSQRPLTVNSDVVVNVFYENKDRTICTAIQCSIWLTLSKPYFSCNFRTKHQVYSLLY